MSRGWRDKKFGSGFLARLDEVVLTIGKDEFTRQDLINLKCPNFKAAANLSAVMEKLDPPSVLSAARRIGFDELSGMEGIGETALWVFTYVVDAAGGNAYKWINAGEDVKTSTACSKSRRRKKAKGRKKKR